MFVKNKFSVAIEGSEAITKNTRQNGQTPAPPARRASYDCLRFGKHVYHAKPALDLNDGSDSLAKSPSSFYVNQWGGSSFMTLSRWSMNLWRFNQAVLKSGRRKESRPSLLDETILTKHTQGPKGPGTANTPIRR